MNFYNKFENLFGYDERFLNCIGPFDISTNAAQKEIIVDLAVQLKLCLMKHSIYSCIQKKKKKNLHGIVEN